MSAQMSEGVGALSSGEQVVADGRTICLIRKEDLCAALGRIVGEGRRRIEHTVDLGHVVGIPRVVETGPDDGTTFYARRPGCGFYSRFTSCGSPSATTSVSVVLSYDAEEEQYHLDHAYPGELEVPELGDPHAFNDVRDDEDMTPIAQAVAAYWAVHAFVALVGWVAGSDQTSRPTAFGGPAPECQ